MNESLTATSMHMHCFATTMCKNEISTSVTNVQATSHLPGTVHQAALEGGLLPPPAQLVHAQAAASPSLHITWHVYQTYTNYSAMYDAAEQVLSHNDAIDQVTLDLAASPSQLGFGGPTVYTYTFMRGNGECQW
jgi:hypothetical protein